MAGKTRAEVYEEHVDRDCTVIPTTDPTLGNCWGWTGRMWPSGYSRINAENKTLQAHRVAYELFIGPIPEGYDTDHLCMHKWCVRPSHLDPVPHAENIRRWAEQTITHCPRGHPYTAANLVKGSIHRRCLTCNTDYSVNKAAGEARNRRGPKISDKTKLGWILRNSGLNAYQWSGLFHIAPAKLSRYVTGRLDISHEDLLTICDVLELEPEDVVGPAYPG